MDLEKEWSLGQEEESWQEEEQKEENHLHHKRLNLAFVWFFAIKNILFTFYNAISYGY